MAKKKTNRKGEIKMTNEEIKNEEQVVTEEVETTVSNEGEENANNETEITEVVVNTEETVIEPEVQEPNPEDPEVKPEELEVKPADETEDQEEIQPDEVKEACVVKCEKLNVRKEASKTSEVVCVISKDAALTVSITKSTEDFYKVYTINNEVLVEGYCVKDFIKIK